MSIQAKFGCILPKCYTSMSLRHFKISELQWPLKISWSVFTLFYSMKDFVEIWKFAWYFQWMFQICVFEGYIFSSKQSFQFKSVFLLSMKFLIQLIVYGFGWTPGVGDGQGGLACYRSWGRKESDTTEQLNWNESSAG